MSPKSVLSRAAGIVARRIAGETILVPTTQRAQDMGLFTLNEVGTFVWERLDGRLALEALAQQIAEHFEVEPARAGEDLVGFAIALAGSGCALEETR